MPTDGPGLGTADELELVAAFALESSDPRFGGFSGIAVQAQRLWLLSDRDTLWTARIELDAATGDLALADWGVGAIDDAGAAGGGLDTEALARAADGTLVAALESDDSLRRLRATQAGDWQAERLHAVGPLIAGAPPNRGIEALAHRPDGALLALSEGARLQAGAAAGALFADGRVAAFGYAVADGFSPVGASVHGDSLFVLERGFGLLGGWRTRLTRSPVAAVSAGTILHGQEILQLGGSDLAENYEGVTAFSAQRQGPPFILLVSDDNFSALQRTIILVLRYAP